jgi:hypothetical protein
VTSRLQEERWGPTICEDFLPNLPRTTGLPYVVSQDCADRDCAERGNLLESANTEEQTSAKAEGPAQAARRHDRTPDRGAKVFGYPSRRGLVAARWAASEMRDLAGHMTRLLRAGPT